MNRLPAFRALENHPYYGSIYKKLMEDDVIFCHKFILENQATDKDEFVTKVHRLFLDIEFKPKNKSAIQDLLIASNTITGREE